MRFGQVLSEPGRPQVGHSVSTGNESTLVAMSESYANVGIWPGPFRTIPPVIEVTSLKKPYERLTSPTPRSRA